MFGGSIDWTALLSLGLICLTCIIAVKAYLAQSEKNMKREQEHELMKTRLYTDRDIKTAQIETASLMQGFNMPADEGDGTQQLINIALQNPELVQQFIGKLKKE